MNRDASCVQMEDAFASISPIPSNTRPILKGVMPQVYSELAKAETVTRVDKVGYKGDRAKGATFCISGSTLLTATAAGSVLTGRFRRGRWRAAVRSVQRDGRGRNILRRRRGGG